MPKVAKDTIAGIVLGSNRIPFLGAQDISISGPSIATQEVTSHGASFSREYIAGLVDNGDVSFTVYPDEADLKDATKAIGYCRIHQREKLKFYVSQVGGFKAEFDGIVTDLSESHPVDGLFSVSVAIKRTGDVTETTT